MVKRFQKEHGPHPSAILVAEKVVPVELVSDPAALAVSPKIVKAKGCRSVVDLADPR